MHGHTLVYLVTFFDEIGVVGRWRAGDAVDLGEVAAQQHLKPAMVTSAADYMTAYGYLRRVADTTYEVTARGKEILEEWFYALGAQSYAPLLGNMLPIARGEKTYGFGKDVNRDLYLNTKASGGLSGRLVFPAVLEYLEKHRYGCLLDLGCGDGTFLELACRGFRDLEVVGLDQSPEVIEIARAKLAAAGFGARSSFVVGDLFQPEQFADHPGVKRAQIATIFYILHEITAAGIEPLLHFLRVWKTAFGSEKPLMVTEIYRPPRDELESFQGRGTLEILLYHDLSGQGVMPREQWYAAYETAGYEIADRIQFADPRRSHAETLIVRPRR